MNEECIKTYDSLESKNLNSKSILKQIRLMIFSGFKFVFDRVMSILGLIIASPIMLIIAIAIKLTSKGPVFFRQLRTGENGKLFTMYKFRSMVANNDVHDFKKKDEHTKIGKIIRKTSLDELPQLISIATGKMSFIGPRPWIHDYYENMNDEQRKRYVVRPGLTGLAQSMGRNNLTIFDKINYDLEYIENYSLIQDIKVIFLTIKAVLTGSGADAGKGTIEKELKELRKSKNK